MNDSHSTIFNYIRTSSIGCSQSIDKVIVMNQFIAENTVVLPCVKNDVLIGVILLQDVYEVADTIINIDDLVRSDVAACVMDELNDSIYFNCGAPEIPYGIINLLDNNNMVMGWIQAEILGCIKNCISDEEKINYYRELQEEYDAIIESSYDGIYITDGEGKTLRMNKACERIEGIKTEEAIGKHMNQLVEEGYYSNSVTMKVLEKKAPVTLLQNVKNGKEVIATGNPIFKDGKIIRVVTNSRDITELNQLKRELNEVKLLTQKYENELENLRTEHLNISGLIANDLSMERVVKTALNIAKFDTTVLIEGESGTGKEVIAKLIHNNSARKDMPLITINCSAIPEALFESELFGYEKGAFTSASNKGKMGLLETANKGTVLLDEISELPLSAQPKLLRAIQEQEITRVGGTMPIKIDVRIIAATNRSLETMVSKKQFRGDLFYRLNVVPVHIPPLCERRNDIIPLIIRFIELNNKKHKVCNTIDNNALQVLHEYHWPGNVRELENLVERLIVTSNDPQITAKDLPQHVFSSKDSTKGGPSLDGRSLKALLESYEKNIIEGVLDITPDTFEMAQILGLDRSTITRKLKKYDLKTTAN